MKNIFIALFLLLSAGTSNAQTPTLVEDVVTGSTGSGPQGLINFNGNIYFAGSDATCGLELREKVGSGPTVMVSDFWPGPGAGAQPYGRKPMIVYNNRLYYDGRTSSSSDRFLMSYDGVNPPSPVPYPLTGSGAPIRSFLVMNNKLYFSADSGNKAGAIFEYTVSGGVKLLATVGQGLKVSNSESTMIAYKGKLYFQKDSAMYNQELHSFDPATGAINRIADIWPGWRGSNPYMFVVAGSKMYFSADDSAHGFELYSYDGTTVKRETDIVPGTGKSFPLLGQGNFKSMVSHKGAIYFVGVTSKPDYVIYKFDTATKAVSTVYNFGSLYPEIQYWHSTGTNLYFCAKTSAEGKELWRYDGNVCKMVADLNPGTGDGAWGSNMVPYQGGLLFSGDNGITGQELYHIADNTASGIQNVSWNGNVSIYPNPATTFVKFRMELQTRESICISLINVGGQEVYTSGLQSFSAGTQTKEIPLHSIVPGQYFYRLTSQSGQLLASGVIVRQ